MKDNEIIRTLIHIGTCIAAFAYIVNAHKAFLDPGLINVPSDDFFITKAVLHATLAFIAIHLTHYIATLKINYKDKK